MSQTHCTDLRVLAQNLSESCSWLHISQDGCFEETKSFWTEKVFCRFLLPAPELDKSALANAFKGKGLTVKVLDVGCQGPGQAVLTILVGL